MQKVTTIHLAGRSYQLEEAGYDTLKKYLDDASAALEGNPDRDEIIADLEAALGEKCSSHITVHKNVVTAAEVDAMLAQMGPIMGAGDNANSGSTQGGAHTGSGDKKTSKRLYQIREGAWISGVCNGIAAYFDIDVALVRIAFVLLASVTHGFGVLLYIVMMIVVPHARTADERAAASGTMPVTAQELIDRVRNSYDHANYSREWKKWKKEAGKWKYRQVPYSHPRQESAFWMFMHELLGLVWLAFIVWIGWFAYNHIPQFHYFIDTLPQNLSRIWNAIVHKVQSNNG
jgi:phage shock protein PspC (stress-responsive transcriptional regulator)